ncbi:MAG: hypothetical protein OXT09_26830 [Myxococcales bacterium]|nr:hypothetical protein [Myxococcales bacterium]
MLTLIRALLLIPGPALCALAAWIGPTGVQKALSGPGPIFAAVLLFAVGPPTVSLLAVYNAVVIDTRGPVARIVLRLLCWLGVGVLWAIADALASERFVPSDLGAAMIVACAATGVSMILLELLSLLSPPQDRTSTV